MKERENEREREKLVCEIKCDLDGEACQVE